MTLPPRATPRPVIREHHGDVRVDYFDWLKDKTNPEVLAYLEAENDWTARVMEPLEGLRRQLYDEMFHRIRHTDTSTPYPDGDFWYFHRTQEGQQYPVHCRKAALDAPEELLLDLNEMATGQSYLALGELSPSDDGRLLAYTTDSTGFRDYVLRIKDLATGKVLTDRISGVGSIAWSARGDTLFYTLEDSAKRKYRLYRHVVGSDRDELVYEETDERFGIGIDRDRSGRFLMLHIGSHTTSEIRYLPADTPEGDWRMLAPRVAGQEYDAAPREGRFFIRVNDTGRNFRIVTASIDRPDRPGWVEWLPHRDHVLIDGFMVFADFLVLWEREDGVPRAQVTDLRSGESHCLSFPEPVYEVYPGMNRVWRTPLLRLEYQSLVTPPSVFDYSMESRELVLLKRKVVVGGYDPEKYRIHRLHAPAPDGTLIPVTVVAAGELTAGCNAPLLLKGYGAYAYPYPVGFSSERLSLLDRGMVVAIAHVRGGGELGRPWHDAGRMEHKMNTFTDFLAVADLLVAEGWTSPDRLIAEGGSAGGLLMGAVTNLRPEGWKAIVAHVPFVDVLNTMLDPSLPLTIGEYEEWGNPAIAEEYQWLRAYCPYTNLERGHYPAMLIRTALNDSQVMYWEPAKYVARIRMLQTNSAPVLLEINMGAGHGGASGRYDRLHELALDYAFVLWQSGLAGAS